MMQRIRQSIYAVRMSFSQAWFALKLRPDRAMLTMAGIAWGIISVTLLLAYGNGFGAAMGYGLDNFGHGVVVCWPAQTSEQAGGQRAGRQIRLTEDDAKLVQSEATLLRGVSPEVDHHGAQVEYLGTSISSPVIRAVWPSYGAMRSEFPDQGRWFEDEDEAQHRRVVVLGSQVKQDLFGGRPAVGESIRIAGTSFLVIGTMEKKIQLSNYNGSDDDSIFMPFSTASQIFDTRYLTVLVFSARATALTEAGIGQVRQILAREHRFSPLDHQALLMDSWLDIKKMIDGLTIGLQILLSFIGALTLGIGGVGVMNIMLVSVNERTREIGLRKALGATRRRILGQFFTEAMILVMSAGVAGMALAQLACWLVGTVPLLGPLYEDTTGRGDIHLGLSPSSVILSFVILAVVGVLSGLIPARRAAAMDPVDSLRYE